MVKKIKITKDGPYLVSGGVPLLRQSISSDSQGNSCAWKDEGKIETSNGSTSLTTGDYALCRCGKSNNKPFCDGSHAEDFDGTETASRKKYKDVAKTLAGPEIDLLDLPELCAEARFCDTFGGSWNIVRETDDPKKKEILLAQCANCPSGRLVPIDKKTGKEIEPKFRPEISVTTDPEMGCSGPIWVKGGVPIESVEGKDYEVRNRVTLCRCGKSRNKPFCDGTHIEISFKE